MSRKATHDRQFPAFWERIAQAKRHNDSLKRSRFASCYQLWENAREMARAVGAAAAAVGTAAERRRPVERERLAAELTDVRGRMREVAATCISDVWDRTRGLSDTPAEHLVAVMEAAADRYFDYNVATPCGKQWELALVQESRLEQAKANARAIRRGTPRRAQADAAVAKMAARFDETVLPFMGRCIRGDREPVSCVYPDW